MFEALPNNPKVVFGLTIWGATVFLGAAIFFSLHAIHISHVAAREQQVAAEVSAPGRWNHGPAYKYKFNLPNRKEFTGESKSPGGKLLALGQFVKVYYDPVHPSTNSLISFTQDQSEYLLIFMYLCGAVLFATYCIIEWRRTLKNGAILPLSGPRG